MLFLSEYSWAIGPLAERSQTSDVSCDDIQMNSHGCNKAKFCLAIAGFTCKVRKGEAFSRGAENLLPEQLKAFRVGKPIQKIGFPTQELFQISIDLDRFRGFIFLSICLQCSHKMIC